MMALLCLSCAVLAVWWGVPPPRRERPVDAGTGGASCGLGAFGAASSGWPVLSAAVVVGSASVLSWSRSCWTAPRGAVLGLTVAGRRRRPWPVCAQRRRRAGLGGAGRVEVARACAALAAQLRIGQVPSEALASAAADSRCCGMPAMPRISAATWSGSGAARPRRPGRAGLLELARAWQVSVQTGAPMSASLEQVAAGLSADQSLRAVVAGELSAPRATGKVMAVLPGCGIGLGYLLGGEPIGWLLGGPLGWGCLLAGAVLACLGVLWIEALARQAA